MLSCFLYIVSKSKTRREKYCLSRTSHVLLLQNLLWLVNSISHATRGKLLWLIFFWFQVFINWNQTIIKPTSKNYLLPVHGWLKFFIPVRPKEQKITEFRQFLERVLILNVYSTLYWFLSRLSGLLQKKDTIKRLSWN